MEEYALRKFNPGNDYLLFYVNEPSIFIGRNQNTLEEINFNYVEEKGIHVVRRMCGGGAVYHDFGNLNFSFITKSEVSKALQVKMNKIESKGHKSVRSRVGNISEFLDKSMDIQNFRERILKGLYNEGEVFQRYKFTPEQWQEVYKLRDEKYGTWDWNFGNSPKFNIKRSRRFPIGEIDLRIFVEKGIITDFKIYVDFFW